MNVLLNCCREGYFHCMMLTLRNLNPVALTTIPAPINHIAPFYLLRKWKGNVTFQPCQTSLFLPSQVIPAFFLTISSNCRAIKTLCNILLLTRDYSIIIRIRIYMYMKSSEDKQFVAKLVSRSMLFFCLMLYYIGRPFVIHRFRIKQVSATSSFVSGTILYRVPSVLCPSVLIVHGCKLSSVQLFLTRWNDCISC